LTPAPIADKYPWGDSNARSQLRRLVLYPAELQGHAATIIDPQRPIDKRRAEQHHSLRHVPRSDEAISGSSPASRARMARIPAVGEARWLPT
jgi:hypothetical protein